MEIPYHCTTIDSQYSNRNNTSPALDRYLQASPTITESIGVLGSDPKAKVDHRGEAAKFLNQWDNSWKPTGKENN
jgi:hypothetical protein